MVEVGSEAPGRQVFSGSPDARRAAAQPLIVRASGEAASVDQRPLLAPESPLVPE
jgi:hypothetical protein